MRRREFITLVGSAAAAWPLAAHAQQPQRMRRIGVLMNGAENEPYIQANAAAFIQAMEKLGWKDGQNLRIEMRWNHSDAERARTLATELVKLESEVILSVSTTNLVALQRVTHSLPIIFLQVSDPVAQGFVPNLTRPGGNLTGFSSFEFSIGGKWLDLLRQLAPGLTRAGVIFNPETSPQSKFFLPAIETAARSFGVQVTAISVRAAGDFEPAIDKFSRQSGGGLILPTDSFTRLHDKLIAELAVRYHLPAISATPSFVKNGGLMYYSSTGSEQLVEQFRQAAAYADRILKGAKPGNLPIQNPTKFALAINLKTAKALGLKIPDKLLFTADEVIE